MNAPQLPPAVQPRPIKPRSSAGLVIVCIIFGLFGLTAASAAFWYHHNFHAPLVQPVMLTAAEQRDLDAKLAVLGGKEQLPEAPATDPAKTIVLNEREVNAWLQEQGLAENIQFHIRNGGFAATVVAPVEEDTPLFGAFLAGRNVRIKVAFNSKLDAQRHLALELADVSVGGISMPNAWLGEMKGVNLLSQNDSDASPFQKSFSAGIKDFQLRNGEMRIVLND